MVSKKAIRTAHILLMTADRRQGSDRCRQLALAGWHVTRVGEWIEALSTVRNERVDLALLKPRPLWGSWPKTLISSSVRSP